LGKTTLAKNFGIALTTSESTMPRKERYESKGIDDRSSFILLAEEFLPDFIGNKSPELVEIHS